MGGFAIDVGTTNSVVARWHPTEERPLIVELPGVCRPRSDDDTLEAPLVVPSATQVIGKPSFWARMGRWGPLARNTFWGKLAKIGQQALDSNQGRPQPSFAPGFKPYLGMAPLRTLARVGSQPYSARDVAHLFMRELLAEVKKNTGERLRELVITVPVESYENYRAELLEIARRLGIKKLRFLDEPVAAAFGYGVGDGRKRLVLVVDFGGGTLDLALVKTGGRSGVEGECEVVAKQGRGIGGDLVDEWILADVCQRLDIPIRVQRSGEWNVWLHLMREEARRVKEGLYLKEKETFFLVPPEELRRFEAQLKGEAEAQTFSRQDFVQLLEDRGLYVALAECVEQLEQQAVACDVSIDAVDDVLMVGGSTLLPKVYQYFEKRFGRTRVRAWQPFEAVAYGACTFAAGQQVQNDFIVHDYAFVTYDHETNEQQYTVIVPRGTRFPTQPDLWKRQLVPTCPLGEPETLYKLVVCELGQNHGSERYFAWDAHGSLQKLGGQQKGNKQPMVVPLNECNPTLGSLRPPHPPGDRKPRLEISFGVNSERWLVVTVVDLWTKRTLKNQDPVVRLL